MDSSFRRKQNQCIVSDTSTTKGVGEFLALTVYLQAICFFYSANYLNFNVTNGRVIEK